MKKLSIWLVAVFAGWLSLTTWVAKDVPYPWELLDFSPSAEKAMAGKAYQSCWESFRQQFPYHIQTIAYADFGSDNSRVVIVSEPPSGFNIPEALNAFSHISNRSYVMTHPVGYDGWVKDAVFVVSGGSKRQRDRAMNKLYEQVYESDYKPHFLNLATVQGRPNAPVQNANYSVTAAEINQWFLKGKDQMLVSADDKGKPVQMREVLDEKRYGVYFTETPGFVVWVLPEGDISESRESAYQFSLESDLILGAINETPCVAIIGRERQTSLNELPPLRVETIMQLAAADKKQISQSYDRMNLFAGKLPGGMDWAPIYLSDDLINTEYGSLLNLTDQMLKSWSQHGEVAYANFSYRKPMTYPYKQRLSDELNTPVLTFNWNTKGAAYTTRFGDYNVVALNRTGSLPVTYIPEGIDASQVPIDAVRQSESKFYDFFSHLTDPNLIRVVEYASLYQIFSAFNIDAPKFKNTALRPSNDVTTDEATRLVNDLHNKSLVATTVNLDNSVLQADDGILRAYLQIVRKAEASQAVEQLETELDPLYRRYGAEGLKILGYLLGHPRLDGGEHFSYNSSLISDDDISAIMKWGEAHTDLFKTLNSGLELFGYSRQKIRDDYVAAWTESQKDWIKTPSVVVSWASDSTIMTGGHNIEARMLGVEADAKLVAGEMRIVEQDGVRKLLVAAEDIERITPQMIRDIEVNGVNGLRKVDGQMLGKARERELVLESKTYGSTRGYTPAAKAVESETGMWVSAGDNIYREHLINGEALLSEVNYPNIQFPKSKLNEIDELIVQMKQRKIAEGEFQVLSMVEEDYTNNILSNYCKKQVSHLDMSSASDIERVFAANPKKTFHLVGHIEDGAIRMEGRNISIPIADIQAAAKRSDVNFMIVGCKSGRQPAAGAAGFVHDINSVDVAEALGMALDGPRDVWSFVNTLARNSELQIVIRDVPFKELGYAAMQERGRVVAVISVGGTTTAGGTALILSAGNSQRKSDDRDTTTKRQIGMRYRKQGVPINVGKSI